MGEIDGAWLPPGGAAFSQDWYKMPDYLGVVIHPNGEPEKFPPYPSTPALAAMETLECNSLTGPICGFVAAYKFFFGGRKQEPEWSDIYATDWKWTPDWKATRGVVCGKK